MKTVATMCASFLLAAASIVAADPAAPNLAIDNVHIRVSDPAQARDWYIKNLGATAGESATQVYFGKMLIAIVKTDKPAPSTGSAIDHIGLSYADLEAKMKELQASGVKVVSPLRDVQGLFKLGFVEDPWGTRIEVVQDSAKLGLHHVHLRAPDPTATLAWYKEQFGGTSGKLMDRIDGLTYGDVWILVQRGDASASEGHAVDHIGFRTPNLDATAKEFKARNVKFTTEPRPLRLAGGATVNFAYIEGPAGAKIELVQR